MIALLGSADEIHVASVREELEMRGHTPLVLDAKRFPSEVELTFDGDRVRLGEEDLSRVRAAYVRNLYATPLHFDPDLQGEADRDWWGTMTRAREKEGFLSGVTAILEAQGAVVVNPSSSRPRSNKLFQLFQYRRSGLRIPPTRITNSPDVARRFYEEVPTCLYKPVVGGAHSKKMTAEDLSRLPELNEAPVTFQEFIEGENVRVYIVGDRVAAAIGIESTDAFDFRNGRESLSRLELPAAIEDQCLRAAHLLGLPFTSVDLRKRGDEYYFLECNWSPMFAGVDRRLNTGIAGALAEFLIRHDAGR